VCPHELYPDNTNLSIADSILCAPVLPVQSVHLRTDRESLHNRHNELQGRCSRSAAFNGVTESQKYWRSIGIGVHLDLDTMSLAF
jgi:hypothetical protein